MLLAFYGLIAWLLYRDHKERASVSPVAWLALAWAIVYASRPVTSWFEGPHQGVVAPESYDEGNPIEALVYVCLIGGAVAALVHRRIRLGKVIRDNQWLFVFYLFWLMSVLWSDYPFITLRRLVKDVGNVVMVLAILSERAPSEAVKAVFVRCAYVCVPLSLMLIRYYPEVGRVFVGYDRSELMYVGVATHKNTLGILALVSSLFLLWDLVAGEWKRRGAVGWSRYGGRVLVLAMCWYLLSIADSMTSLVCAALGSCLLVAASLSSVRQRPGRVEAYGVAVLLLVWTIDLLFDVKEAFVESLGRDTTLTTRTDVWPVLLRYQENALVGAGFNSFWAGRRLVELAEAVGGIIQAHNGYLETYLNGGIVGLSLLGIVLAAGYLRVRREIALGSPTASIRLVFLLVAIVHNLAEASFHRLSLLWFVTVFALMEFRRVADPSSAVPDVRAERWSVAGARRL